jgi:hypothetical protein
MNRQLALMFLAVPFACLAASPAAAQYPYSVAWGQPDAAAVGPRLSQTAAYPTGPVYYPMAVPAYPGSNLYYRMADAQADPAARAYVPQPASPPQAAGQPAYGYVECQCERCRRARGEYAGGSGVIDGLWELERRKNSFLKRLFFGD